SRVDSLAMHGRLAAEIAVGAIMMFFVAAILEGGFRELVASTPGRFAVAAATGVGWLAYVLLPPPGETRWAGPTPPARCCGATGASAARSSRRKAFRSPSSSPSSASARSR